MSKLMIEIFIPIYLFINVCRSTSVAILEKNYLTIISMLFYILISSVLAYLYTLGSKMDIRYRFTFIALTCFTDIKRVHYLMVNSFCYHLKNKNASETDFCYTKEKVTDNVLNYNYVHIFFQGVIVWYLCFNFIRVDRKYSKVAKEVGMEINKETEIKVVGQVNTGPNQNPETEQNLTTNREEDKKLVKGIYSSHQRADVLHFSKSFYSKIKNYYSTIKKEKEKKFWYKLVYIMLKAPLIALFTGFIVGFITVIQKWIYNQTTVVSVS
jgi:hypothetical protein